MCSEIAKCWITKECTTCGEAKVLGEYHVLKTGKYGKHPSCKACSKIANKAYNNKHKDKLKVQCKLYQEENQEAIQANKKAYREAHKVEKATNDKLYREANKEKIAAQKKKYRAENKDKIALSKKLYSASEAGKAVKDRGNAKRELQIRETRDGSVTKETLRELYEEQGGMCAICSCDLTQLKRSNVHMDHIQPLSKGGSHVLENVQWTCMDCNLGKGNNTDDE